MITINPEFLQDNLFKLTGKDWMLICAGNIDKYNMMTASWGSFGVLWNKHIAMIFIRPTRYTYQFVESNNYFTLNFFDNTHRDLLNLMGAKSGREINKMNHPGLDANKTSLGNVYFRQARIVLECKKIYADYIKPEMFLDSKIEKLYPKKDYHRFFIGEILNCNRQS